MMTLPYGQSPKTASVAVFFVHVSVAVCVSARPAAVSPSETVRVRFVAPAAVHVNVGFSTVVLLSVPELADQV